MVIPVHEWCIAKHDNSRYILPYLKSDNSLILQEAFENLVSDSERDINEGLTLLKNKILLVENCESKLESMGWNDIDVSISAGEVIISDTSGSRDDVTPPINLSFDFVKVLIDECLNFNFKGGISRIPHPYEESVEIALSTHDANGIICDEYVVNEVVSLSPTSGRHEVIYVFPNGGKFDLDVALYLMIGETKEVVQKPFGSLRISLVKEVDLSELPNDLEIKVGMTVGLAVPGEGNTIGKVLEVNDKTAKVDFNHPRAGELVYCTITRIG